MHRSRLNALRTAVLLAISYTCLTSAVLAQDAKTIPLPPADREYIDKHLGRGVVGKAVPAKPVGDVRAFGKLDQDQVVTGRYVYGPSKGKLVTVSVERLKRKGGRPAWKRSTGAKTIEFGQLGEDGSLKVYAIVDREEGVITRYSPFQPLFFPDMQPGSSKKMRIMVTVADLSSPTEVDYRGHLDLVYTYIGAYEVTVPMGKYEALLFKWDYKGKIGPANIKDRQYWFYAPGVGPVATIYQTDVSAFLIYQSHQKEAGVAIKREVRKK